MKLMVPWNRPGYLNGAHPLLYAYLNGYVENEHFVFEDVRILSDFEGKVAALKERFGRCWREMMGTPPRFAAPALQEFLSKRGLLGASDFFSGSDADTTFHHTALYPLETSYILHFENPLTIFAPFLWYGNVSKDFRLRNTPLFELSKAVLESDRCKLLISHMETFIRVLDRVFDSPAIARKTRLVRPVLPLLNERPRRTATTFMFSNSVASNDDRFYLRGGAVAIRSFLALAAEAKDVELVVLSRIPESLPEALRDAIFRHDRIKVIEPGVSEAQVNEICRGVDVLLNPSVGLHSMTILRAMSAGSLVISSDIVGCDEYIVDGVTGYLLKGVKERVNFVEPESGLIHESYDALDSVHQLMYTQLTGLMKRVWEQTDQTYQMRVDALEFVRSKFSFDSPETGLRGIAEALRAQSAPYPRLDRHTDLQGPRTING